MLYTVDRSYHVFCFTKTPKHQKKEKNIWRGEEEVEVQTFYKLLYRHKHETMTSVHFDGSQSPLFRLKLKVHVLGK